MASSIQSIFDREDYSQYKNAFYGRVKELTRRGDYYSDAAYKKFKTNVFANFVVPSAIKNVKAIFNPLHRAVSIDCGIIPNGWKLNENITDDESKSFHQVLEWSDWKTQGVLYVHYGAKFGCVGLKLIDDRVNKIARIEIVDPTMFMLVMDNWTRKPKMSIYVSRVDEGEFAEVIDEKTYKTFLNGMPYKMNVVNVNGQEEFVAEYENSLGFIPYIQVKHIEDGSEYGECTYQNAIEQLLETNDLATQLTDIIRKHSDPKYKMTGIKKDDQNYDENGKIKPIAISKDNVTLLPEGVDLQAMYSDIQIADVNGVIDSIYKAVKSSIAELAFDELRGQSQISTSTVELQLIEFILKVNRCRPNYDAGIVHMMRMVGQIASDMGLNDLVTLADLPENAIDSDRDVLPMSVETKLDIEIKRETLKAQQGMAIGEGLTNGNNSTNDLPDVSQESPRSGNTVSTGTEQGTK